MTFRIQFLFLASILALVPSAVYAAPQYDGVISGGGGKAVVCPSQAQKIESIELLDLWEARTLYGNPAQPVEGDLKTAVSVLLKRMKNSYPFKGSGDVGHGQKQGQDHVLDMLEFLAERFFKPDPKVLRLRGTVLEPTPDSAEVARPIGCDIVQVVNYQPGGRILINQDLFEKMDATNQAALIAHEAMYALLRMFAHETNSIRARRAVGYVAAGFEFAPVEWPEFPAGAIQCQSEPNPYQGDVQVVIYPGEQKNGYAFLNLNFQRVGGTELIGLSTQTHTFGMAPDDADAILNSHCREANGFGYGYGMTFDGPVELDRTAQAQFTCHNGQFRFTVAHSRPGSSESESYTLTCQKK